MKMIFFPHDKPGSTYLIHVQVLKISSALNAENRLILIHYRRW